MAELLKADIKRVLRDKLLIVMGILAIVFAVITPLLFVFIFSLGDMMDDPMISGLISAKSQFFQSFSMTNNLGLIAPVLLAIVLCKDFSFGTVRNKIIAGKSRSKIFLSLFTVCALVLVAVMMLSAFVSLGVSLIFFEYQPQPFTVSDFGYFIASVAFELLVLLFMSALLSWLCACMKNVGVAIVLFESITFALLMIGSVIQIVAGVLTLTEGTDILVDVLSFLGRINPAMAVSYIGTGYSYNVEDVLYLTIPPVVLTLGFLGLGLHGFNKKDLK